MYDAYFFLSFTEVELIYKVVNIYAAQQSDSYTCTHVHSLSIFFFFFFFFFCLSRAVSVAYGEVPRLEV